MKMVIDEEWLGMIRRMPSLQLSKLNLRNGALRPREECWLACFMVVFVRLPPLQ